MNLPESLVIFGREYEIRDVSPIHASEGVLGVAAYRDGLIYLDQDMDLSLALSTLWHEAVHIGQQEILGVTDEAQARWMALFIHTFLVNNPDVLQCYLSAIDSMAVTVEDDGSAA